MDLSEYAKLVYVYKLKTKQNIFYMYEIINSVYEELYVVDVNFSSSYEWKIWIITAH